MAQIFEFQVLKSAWKRHTGIPGPWTQELEAGFWMLDSGRRTLDAESRSLDPGIWTFDSGYRTLEHGRWTLVSGSWILDAER